MGSRLFDERVPVGQDAESTTDDFSDKALEIADLRGWSAGMFLLAPALLAASSLMR